VSRLDFDAAFSAALRAIDEQYVRMPIADSAPVIRERAFAYELYHRLRESCAVEGYTLTGELEKAAHPNLRDTDVKRLAPDLLVHVPGDRHSNFVAVEIKGGVPRTDGFQKDLASLCLLRDRFRYERLIYLVYGISDRQVTNLAERMRRVRALRGRPADLSRIELWVRIAGRREPKAIEWAHNESSQLSEARIAPTRQHGSRSRLPR
jgi:hypothetical protein